MGMAQFDSTPSQVKLGRAASLSREALAWCCFTQLPDKVSIYFHVE